MGRKILNRKLLLVGFAAGSVIVAMLLPDLFFVLAGVGR